MSVCQIAPARPLISDTNLFSPPPFSYIFSLRIFLPTSLISSELLVISVGRRFPDNVCRTADWVVDLQRHFLSLPHQRVDFHKQDRFLW